ncbi:MAG: DUF1707 domain-containing protein [Nakamurella sp.]
MSHPVADDVRPDPTVDARTAAAGRGFRASDADRQLTVMVLQDAVARGLLTTQEGSVRMEAAYTATHHAQLPPLTADLPPAEPERPSRSRATRKSPTRMSGTGWRHRGSALQHTLLRAFAALILFVGGTGRHRRLRLGIATALVVLAVVAALSAGGDLFTDGDFPRGDGRMPNVGDLPGMPR